jgi:hypothetical protein
MYLGKKQNNIYFRRMEGLHDVFTKATPVTCSPESAQELTTIPGRTIRRYAKGRL